MQEWSAAAERLKFTNCVESIDMKKHYSVLMFDPRHSKAFEVREDF